MGWDIDKGYIELDFSSQLVDGVPYLVLGHRVPPVYLAGDIRRNCISYMENHPMNLTLQGGT